jgi:hypothetical protein
MANMFINRVFTGVLALSLAAISSCNNSDFAGENVKPEKQEKADATPAPVNQPAADTAIDTVDAVDVAADPNDPSPTVDSGTTVVNKLTPEQLETAGGKTDAYVGGPSAIYHIGDGAFKDSSCKAQIANSPLKGTTYIFTFEVLESNSSVTINIEHFCGVDNEGKNVAQLVTGSGKVFSSGSLRVGGTSFNFGTKTLPKGTYSVQVVSGKRTVLFQSDYDDFNVGKVRLRSDRPVVKPGTVSAR